LELLVEVEKEMRGFKLQVAFTAGPAPLGILGPSGAGKSMLLRMIAGLERPGRGRIVLDGRTLFDSAAKVDVPSRARRIGLLMQDYALFPHLTVEQNIAFGLHRLAPAARRERVRALMAEAQLAGLERRQARQLSGGQQQRAALMRALAPEPRAILLDEPLTALDVHLRSQMEKLVIETLTDFQGVSLYVTHNLEEAYRVASQLAVMEHGRKIAFGPKEEIFRNPRTYNVALYTGCKNFSAARPAADNKVEATEWGATLTAARPLPNPVCYAAIRAHHLALVEDAAQPNTLPCTLSRMTEGPFRNTLYLKLAASGAAPRPYHLQAEVTREVWLKWKEIPQPWPVCLHPERLMLLEG
jgi:ABC-type sulfate/molybdate transport systems ATPase subunit